MKNFKRNFKIAIATILTAILLTVATGVYAYNGIDVDPSYKITMPNSLTNGKGTVSASVSENIKYQFVEINQSKYSAIKKYEAQLALIQAYVNGQYSDWTNAEESEEYKKLVESYESTYNEKVSELYTKYERFDSETISIVRSLWVHELTDYSESAWQSSTDSTISIDLTTFEGTKYYIAWVKIGNTLDAEVYVVTGTGTIEEPKQEEPKQEEPKQEEPKQEEPKKEEPVKPTTKPDTTASSEGKVMPKTGVSSTVLGLIAAAGTSAGISYRKYRKIK